MADSIQDIIEQAARQYNVDPVALKAVAFLESRFDPSAKNPRSSAGGLFQQIDSNAKAYGVKNRMDPKQSALGAARFMADNKRTLSRVLGREPNAGELYLAHQQGPGGASKILRNPNARAVDVVGADAVKLNGGNANMTAAEFGSLWTNKAERAAARVSDGQYTAQLSAPARGDMYGGGGSDTMMGGEGDDNVLTRDPGAIERTYRAFVDGDMSPEERAAYEADVRAGRMPIPTGMAIGEPINVEVAQIENTYNAYQNGDLSDEEKAAYEADVRAGIMPLPEGVGLQFGQIQPMEAVEENRFSMEVPDELAGMEAPPPVGDVRTEAPVDGEPGWVERWGRQGKLAGRYLGQGAAGIVGVVQDPINVLISNALGLEVQPPLRQQVSKAMTEAGFPQPETMGERIIGSGLEAMVGAGGAAGLAAGAGRALAPGVAQSVANISAMAPAAQVAGGLGAGVGQQATAEAGGGPLAQTAAALAGGLVGSGVGSAMTTPDMPAAAPRAMARQSAAVDSPNPRDITPDLPPQMTRSEIGEIAVRASRGDKIAQKRLAKLSAIDPEAEAAARRLGIDAPADVFGLNTQIDEITGMLRTQKGSAASQQWNETVKEASNRASEIMRGETRFDSISDASDAVRRSLDDSIKELKTTAGNIYDDVGAKMPKGIRVVPNQTKTFVDDYLSVRSEDSPYLPPDLKKLLSGLGRKDMTYADLDDARKSIGRSIGSFNGVYKDADQKFLNTLYAKMSEDQMAIVGAQLGESSVDQLKSANALTTAYKGLQDDVVSLFGKSKNGSIASLMRNAMTSAKKGDKKLLFDSIKAIPKDLRRDTLITSLEEMSKVQRGTNAGKFSFQEFHKTWGNLKSQTPIMAALRSELGPEAFDTLSDLASASKSIQKGLDQTQAAKQTGASLTAEVFVDGVMTRMLSAPAGKTVMSMTGGVAAAALASPAGPLASSVAGVGTSTFLATLKLGGKRAAAAARFMDSPEFKRLAVAAANGSLSEGDIARASKSAAFVRWAKNTGIKDPKGFLVGALTPQQAVEIQQIQQEQTDGN